MKAWNKYTDNELDDFFKEEVLKNSNKAIDKNWQRLATSLEEEGLLHTPNPWKKYLALLGIAVLFFTATYFIVSSSVDTGSYDTVLNAETTELRPGTDLSFGNSKLNSKDQIIDKGNILNENSESAESEKISNSSILEEKKQINNSSFSTGTKNTQNETKSKSSLQESNGAPLARDRSKFINSSSTSFSLGLKTTNQSKAKTLADKQSNESSELISGFVPSEETKSNATNSSSSSQFTKKFDGLTVLNTIKDLSTSKLFSQKSTEVTSLGTLESSTASAVNTRPKFKKNLYLNLSYSPDFSAVVKNSFFKMGHNFSAQLEYQFLPRWSVMSGVIKSQKHYNAGNDQMSWPTNWGEMPKELEGMEGNCNVLDIPLNFRYNIKGDDRATMFVVGGISNFILLQEQYDYIYPEYIDTDNMMKSWEGQSGFLFAGMANLSLGYERMITPSISLQIEPFVKAPLRDFGFTDVKLISTGVFVTGRIKIK